MMFIIHAAFALGLLSLIAGSTLYIWSLNAQNKKGMVLAKIIGFVVMVISTISLIGTFYLGIKIWREIYFLHLVQVHYAEEQNALMNQLTPIKSATSANKVLHHKK